MSSVPDVILRKAHQTDERAIRDLIHLVHINPMDLHWEHFLVAEDSEGLFLGCGQIKVHSGGLQELASIAVIPEARHQRIASQIIQQLVRSTNKDLYLTCRSRLETFYQPFGFVKVNDPNSLSGYFKHIWKLSNYLVRMKIFSEPVCIMYRKNK